LTDGVTGQGVCQVRSETGLPCRHLATTRVLGVPFCEIHACEQKIYFLIGELTEAQGSVARSAEHVRALCDVPVAEEIVLVRHRSQTPALLPSIESPLRDLVGPDNVSAWSEMIGYRLPDGTVHTFG